MTNLLPDTADLNAPALSCAPDGLTSVEVSQRVAAGQVNRAAASPARTVRQIIASNVLTFFNLINSLIFILILATGRYANTLFMGVILSNLLIGIIQEIRAKRTLDKLTILTAARAKVMRDGQETDLAAESVVMDDLLVLERGDQIVADAVVVRSEEFEADESLLTGESTPVMKRAGDRLLSGSFAVSGSASAQVTGVGADSYAQQITLEAKRYRRAQSEIIRTVSRLIRFVSILIVPTGLLLFTNQYFRSQVSWQDAVVSSAAGMIGMIPEGLVLLTSVALALGTIRLARKRAVVQELAGIELLARVDTLCLDKTGTLTRGVLQVVEIVRLPAARPYLDEALAATLAAFKEKNATALAMADYLGKPPGWPVTHKVSFSSDRKWSGVSYPDHGTWLLGAPEIILAGSHPDMLGTARKYAARGMRVVLAAWSGIPLAGDSLPDSIEPQALIVLSDTVRPEAQAALDYFAANDVTVKILSGDSPAAVAAIAASLGIQGADRSIDAALLGDDREQIRQAVRDYTIFGRVTPAQKRQLIRAMKEDGHTVAMTGDGANDVLALHEADCSIVMASGCDAAKRVAHIVLLDSDFTVMPGVVREGRQVINNIERVASLFLVKTTYALLLSISFIILGSSYPFDPIHQTLLGGFSIGIPAFFLAMEQSHQRVRPGFFRRILQTAIPGGLTVTLMMLAAEYLGRQGRIPAEQVQMVSVLVAGMIGLFVLLGVSWPLNAWRAILLAAMAALFAAESIVFSGLLGFAWPEPASLLWLAVLSILSGPLLLLLSSGLRRLMAFWKN